MTPRLSSYHRNIDRIFAIWQALYPESYVTPQVPGVGTYTNSPDKFEDVNTGKYSPYPHIQALFQTQNIIQL